MTAFLLLLLLPVFYQRLSLRLLSQRRGSCGKFETAADAATAADFKVKEPRPLTLTPPGIPP